MLKFISLLSVLIFISLGSACMTRGLRDDGHFYGKHSEYVVGNPGKPWKQISLRASGDISWLNQNDGATLLTNSHCKGVADVPLEALTQHLLIGLTEQEVVSQKKISLSGREALRSEIKLKMVKVIKKYMTNISYKLMIQYLIISFLKLSKIF